ncbi:DUF1173 domain-containing protein (plasmid) [Polymorphobacter sp. PAMC 29334]|uniref:DUF1173 family protein n=1 Tax=Polymorphobacter sp. PAMC 29334 TaxID=2862331 RepID=UPI001C66F662|nr:DUF1173 family protein [Polymorphobacter sp. PAMC 29334]QYE33150.1 DUF1173 domain-containing protein [Polymorphobacter sp. PAMC 29334]
MQSYRLFDRSVSPADEDFEAILARAHAKRARALCECRDDVELALYVAKRTGGCVLARWPGSGAQHLPGCDHYDAPDDLTGIGQVLGNAVCEDETGDVYLKLAFPLKRGAARAAPSAITNEKPALKHNGRKLSMRGLLHVLWYKAELTHWVPRMASKRNWYVVRRALLGAVEHCWAKGATLGPRVFIPETFKSDDVAGIAGRRHTTLAPARVSDTLMVVIGEVKSIGASRYGEVITLRHLADWPLYMDTDTAARFHKRFALEHDLWRSSAAEDGHLIIAASFALRPSGAAEMFDIALMPVTREWLPYENLPERELLRIAVAAQRKFVKGLRVDLNPDRTIANITLTDTQPTAIAVHIAADTENEIDNDALAAFLATEGVEHFAWRPGATLPIAGVASSIIDWASKADHSLVRLPPFFDAVHP